MSLFVSRIAIERNDAENEDNSYYIEVIDSGEGKYTLSSGNGEGLNLPDREALAELGGAIAQMLGR